MAQLLSVVTAASELGQSLKNHAENPAFAQAQQTAFESDTLRVASATQAMAEYPAFGFDSPGYDNALSRIAEAKAASDAAIPADLLSLHRAHNAVTGAVAAMEAVTAKPAGE